MKIISKSVIAIFLIYIVLFSPKAHAYLDPGTGSMIFQILAASIITFVYSIRSFIFKLFKKNKDENIEQ